MELIKITYQLLIIGFLVSVSTAMGSLLVAAFFSLVWQESKPSSDVILDDIFIPSPQSISTRAYQHMAMITIGFLNAFWFIYVGYISLLVVILIATYVGLMFIIIQNIGLFFKFKGRIRKIAYICISLMCSGWYMYLLMM